MSPKVGLLLCLCVVVSLIVQDIRARKRISWTVIVPIFLLTVRSSRPLSAWFDSQTAQSNFEGNAVDTFFFACLAAFVFWILSQRKISWRGFLLKNRELILLYAYFFLSAFWADDSFAVMKRVVKDFLCVLVALVVLTEKDPTEFLRAVGMRVAAILFPLSIVLGKYFPDIGRGYDFAGNPMLTGVTHQKNALGMLTLVFCLILLWELLWAWPGGEWRKRWLSLLSRLTVFFLGVFLLLACESKTSLACLVLGGAVLFGGKWLMRLRKGKRILYTLLIGIPALVAIAKATGLQDVVLTSLGRDSTFTGRTEIWEAALQEQKDPIFGSGFAMFWDSEQGTSVAQNLARLRAAHNGYVDVYLDGGAIGVTLLIAFLVASGKRTIDRMFRGSALALVGVAFWVVSIVYNFSETSFLRLDTLWIVFLITNVAHPSAFRGKLRVQSNSRLESGERTGGTEIVSELGSVPVNKPLCKQMASRKIRCSAPDVFASCDRTSVTISSWNTLC